MTVSPSGVQGLSLPCYLGGDTKGNILNVPDTTRPPHLQQAIWESFEGEQRFWPNLGVAGDMGLG